MGHVFNCKSRFSVAVCDSCHYDSKLSHVKVFRLTELEKATQSFSQQNLIGKGSHSCVYRGVLSDGNVVAVKRPTAGRRGLQDQSSYDNELAILSMLQHRHLVNLIGYSNESPEKLLVVEYMENGTLYDLLHHSPKPLSWPRRLHMALQAAKALSALHSTSPPIVHRDVKSSNILVDCHWNAKLGDLGLAVRDQVEGGSLKLTPPAGTMGYIDPLYETPSQVSTKSDVFSYGILLLEIISGRKAIDVRYHPASVVDWAVPIIDRGKCFALYDSALKAPQNTRVLDHLADIARRCVGLDVEKRPSMPEIVKEIQDMRRKLPISVHSRRPRTKKKVVPHRPHSLTPVDCPSSALAFQRSSRTEASSGGRVSNDGATLISRPLKKNHKSFRDRLRSLSDSSRVSDIDEKTLGTPSNRNDLDRVRASLSVSTMYRDDVVDCFTRLSVSPSISSSYKSELRKELAEKCEKRKSRINIRCRERVRVSFDVDKWMVFKDCRCEISWLENPVFEGAVRPDDRNAAFVAL